ncbi:hypothetical protein ACSBR2_000688 [Camellia fascicularis]
MMQALNPHSTTSKTAAIMSRYRPIAPRPDTPIDPISDDTSSLSQKIKNSPYLRKVWPNLQARPTRTRKRGRTSLAPPAIKRPKTQHLFTLSPPPPPPPPHSSSMHGFSSHALQFNTLPQSSSSLVTLPLLPEIDLNRVVDDVPEEKDFLQQFQPGGGPIRVITPQPVRPVGSSITVGSINKDADLNLGARVRKKREEVEEEVESEALPAVVSDSNNKVRLANSAYKEMVGQPECSWLDSMVVACEGRLGGSACKRICGEVVLRFSETSSVPISSSPNGFSCSAKIEWGSNGKKNSSSVHAFCDVMRLCCESKDYHFAWRFHTTREASQSGSNA